MWREDCYVSIHATFDSTISVLQNLQCKTASNFSRHFITLYFKLRAVHKGRPHKIAKNWPPPSLFTRLNPFVRANTPEVAETVKVSWTLLGRKHFLRESFKFLSVALKRSLFLPWWPFYVALLGFIPDCPLLILFCLFTPGKDLGWWATFQSLDAYVNWSSFKMKNRRKSSAIRQYVACLHYQNKVAFMEGRLFSSQSSVWKAF